MKITVSLEVFNILKDFNPHYAVEPYSENIMHYVCDINYSLGETDRKFKKYLKALKKFLKINKFSLKTRWDRGGYFWSRNYITFVYLTIKKI